MSKIHRIICALTVMIMSIIIISQEKAAGPVFVTIAYSAGWYLVAQILSPWKKKASAHLDKIEARHNAKPL
jgi:hypothetical protein